MCVVKIGLIALAYQNKVIVAQKIIVKKHGFRFTRMKNDYT